MKRAVIRASVVMVLMTPTVNKLVSKAECDRQGGAFVAGFFFGLDLDPAFRTDSRSNKGEVFYSIVADPTGTLSCSHSTTSVQRLVPVTFVRYPEEGHLIARPRHVRDACERTIAWFAKAFGGA